MHFYWQETRKSTVLLKKQTGRVHVREVREEKGGEGEA
jgi:hypothetical protein